MAQRPAVPAVVLETLTALAQAHAAEGFYLAGGTSLALRFGHALAVR